MQVGGDTHIALSGDYTIILQNTHKSDLIADDFVNYHADRIGTAGDDIHHDTGVRWRHRLPGVWRKRHSSRQCVEERHDRWRCRRRVHLPAMAAAIRSTVADRHRCH